MQIRVKVTPGARKEKVVKKDDGTFEITIKEDAEGNRANMRVREILSELFQVPLARVWLIRGHRVRNKIIQLG